MVGATQISAPSKIISLYYVVLAVVIIPASRLCQYTHTHTHTLALEVIIIKIKNIRKFFNL